MAKLSEELKQIHESGDCGFCLEGLHEKAANLEAMLDRIVVRGMMEGETEVECLQRQLEDAKNENAGLRSRLAFEASQNEELSRYRKMEFIQRDFNEAKESLQGIVETLSQYIKVASDEEKISEDEKLERSLEDIRQTLGFSDDR